MKTVSFNKKVEVFKLHQELLATGFLVLGVTYDDGLVKTTIQFDDSETKDPITVINAHNPAPLPDINWLQEYQNATLVADKLKVFVKRTGIISLTIQEILTGRLS